MFLSPSLKSSKQIGHSLTDISGSNFLILYFRNEVIIGMRIVFYLKKSKDLVVRFPADKQQKQSNHIIINIIKQYTKIILINIIVYNIFIAADLPSCIYISYYVGWFICPRFFFHYINFGLKSIKNPQLPRTKPTTPMLV